MNKIFIYVAFALVFVSCGDNASSKIKAENLEVAKERDEIISLGAPAIEFDKTEYDFGEIIEGDNVEGVFNITNTGKVNLVISDAKASCGCTVPEWPKDPIAPGETAQLKFKFSSKGRSGKQSKSITLTTNTEKVKEIIRVTGFINKK